MKNIRKLSPEIYVGLTDFEKSVYCSRITTLNVNSVIKKTCDFLKISKEAFLSDSREKNLVKGRHITILIIRNELKFMTVGEIGRSLNRDHSTITKSYSTAKDRYALEKDFKKDVDSILKKLNK